MRIQPLRSSESSWQEASCIASGTPQGEPAVPWHVWGPGSEGWHTRCWFLNRALGEMSGRSTRENVAHWLSPGGWPVCGRVDWAGTDIPGWEHYPFSGDLDKDIPRQSYNGETSLITSSSQHALILLQLRVLKPGVPPLAGPCLIYRSIWEENLPPIPHTASDRIQLIVRCWNEGVSASLARCWWEVLFQWTMTYLYKRHPHCGAIILTLGLGLGYANWIWSIF